LVPPEKAAPAMENQRTVVDSDDFLVVVLSPIGVTLVPLELDPEDTTPLELLVRWLLVSLETTGAAMAGVVVVVVLDEDDEDCA
jgi:hypothetical protein